MSRRKDEVITSKDVGDLNDALKNDEAPVIYDQSVTGSPDISKADSPEAGEEKRDEDADAEEEEMLIAEEKKPEPFEQAMKKDKPQTLKEEDGFEMFSQLVACVHFLASMMPADVFQQAKDSFPVITKIR